MELSGTHVPGIVSFLSYELTPSSLITYSTVFKDMTGEQRQKEGVKRGGKHEKRAASWSTPTACAQDPLERVGDRALGRSTHDSEILIDSSMMRIACYCLDE